MKRYGIRISFLLLFFTLAFSQASGQTAWNKQGGVCFRIDDNNALWKYKSFDSLFTIYNYKFCTAMCLESASWEVGYLEKMKQYWAKGHEFMDHTPSHSTCSIILTKINDTSIYHGNPFVDHINYDSICFKWESVDTTTVQGEGLVSIYNNLVVSDSPGGFQDLYYPVYIPMLFIPLTNQVYTWTNLRNSNPNDPDSLTILSMWEEYVDLGQQTHIPLHKLTSYDVVMPWDVYVLLGERTLQLCNMYTIDRPWDWIHPFGDFPQCHNNTVAQTFGAELGYTGGATDADESYKTYGEYNPDNDKQFAMIFGNFSSTGLSLEKNKQIIADGIAKHLLLISENHFFPNAATWHQYLQQVDSLLTWLQTNNIPVFTQTQWKSLLFDSLTNPFINIFPLLQTDINSDLNPDGYELTDGIMIQDDGVPQSGNKSIQVTTDSWASFFKIKTLGGLAKGVNKFSFYSKGSPGTLVWLFLTYPETGLTETLSFPADSAEWTYHSAPVDIPENVSVINIEMKAQPDSSADTRISGMDLHIVAGPVVASVSISLMTNEQLQPISLDTLIYDPNYSLQQLTLSITNPGVLDYDLDTVAGILWVFKPSSFWTGSDSLKLTAINPEGGVGSAWLKFTATIVDICKGQTITLHLLNPPAGSTFLWTATPPDPSLVEPTAANPTVSPAQTTYYSVTVNATGQPYTENLTVYVHLVENVILSGPLPAYCANAGPVQLHGTPAGGIFSGNGVVDDYFYPTLASVGPNTLRYTATDPSGCEGEDTLVVTIYPIPQLFLPPDSTICHWQTIILDAGVGYDTYLWSTGSTSSYTEVNATGMIDSTSHITLIVTKNGCPGFDTTIVHFKACTGIDSRMPDAGCLIVYPNPVSTTLTVEWDCLTPNLTGAIFDPLGIKLLTFNLLPGKNIVDTGAIPSGVYILSVKGEEIAVTTRFVKIP